jgi:hypothetical protein
MMDHRDKIARLLDKISSRSFNAEVSIELLAATLDLSEADSRIWVEELGDPLASLSGAKAFVEHLSYNWHEAMNIGARALEGRRAWVLPDLAPHAIAWALSRLLAEAGQEQDLRRSLN